MKKMLPEYMSRGAIIVDVRSPGEFSMGCNPNSINIPLTELSEKAKTLDKSKPIILCCASGARSGAAVGVLKAMGFSEVVNGGSWGNTIC